MALFGECLKGIKETIWVLSMEDNAQNLSARLLIKDNKQ